MLPSAPIHVIIVDDDPEDCELFKLALEQSPVPVALQILYDGESLLRQLSNHDTLPDAIFLDINMPKKNGREVLAEIRSNKKFNAVRIIMFSTSASVDDIDYSYDHGANLYIPKSIFFSDQKNILKTLFSDEWEKYLVQVPKEIFVLNNVHSPEL